MNVIYKDKDIYWFVKENNELSGILREPTSEEIAEFNRLMGLSFITIDNLKRFLRCYSPKAQLRDEYGLDIDDAPWGGPHIKENLQKILTSSLSPWHTYMDFEKLRPFTESNGISGRAIWAWKTRDIGEGFLLGFYRQTINTFKNSFTQDA